MAIFLFDVSVLQRKISLFCFVLFWLQSLYKSLDVLYLTDESDTMLAYEQRGREKRPSVSAYESGMQALQNMDRIPQVEVMHGKLLGIIFPLLKLEESK